MEVGMSMIQLNSSHDAVELIPDLVLDQGVHVLMHLGEGGISVHSVVIGNDNTNQSLYY